MTNREWLASLTDEELAKELIIDICSHCLYSVFSEITDTYQCLRPGDGRGCRHGITDWLKAEHKEGK